MGILIRLWLKMKTKIVIVDFNDSFTHNIAAQLHQMNLGCDVVSHLEIQTIEEEDEKRAIIYGPGPGHPADYPHLNQVIQSLSERDNIYQMGICLGHQLLWYNRGISIKRSVDPIHGKGQEVCIPNWEMFSADDWGRKVQVQRYNSLVLDIHERVGTQFYFTDGECQMGWDKNVLTYQFHPESVGTSYPDIFFRPLIDFLYNGDDD